MANWNQLLAVLDATVGFPNKLRSSVKKKWQGFDQWKDEHVILLEYRVKVNPGTQPPLGTFANRRDLHAKQPIPPMGTLRELMDVKFVNKVDSTPPKKSPKPQKVPKGGGISSRNKLKRRQPIPPVPPV